LKFDNKVPSLRLERIDERGAQVVEMCGFGRFSPRTGSSGQPDDRRARLFEQR
jgi:hypothetical protein